MYINGMWQSSADRLPVRDPSDGSVIAELAVSDDRDCAAALDAAAAAFPAFSAISPRERAEMLRRTFEIMTVEAEELARLVARENGKVLADARAEISYAAEFFVGSPRRRFASRESSDGRLLATRLSSLLISLSASRC
jgi:succinate-semialdehyde dehydrogenase/glutarate-semialdehyde dehydrogenase